MASSTSCTVVPPRFQTISSIQRCYRPVDFKMGHDFFGYWTPKTNTNADYTSKDSIYQNQSKNFYLGFLFLAVLAVVGRMVFWEQSDSYPGRSKGEGIERPFSLCFCQFKKNCVRLVRKK